MANVVYENFIIESKLNDILNTKMNTRNFMTIDDSLTEGEGMIKKINRYTYSGTVETVAEGAGNTVRGSISFEAFPYEVAVAQQTADYTDEQVMQDSKVVDYILEGGATAMVNDMNSKYFAELAKATLVQEYATANVTYDAVVDAIAKMNLEDESGLFLIINPAMKAGLRKDAEFKAAELGSIIYNGQIGSIAGVPVVVSKLVPADVSYLATKDAVTLYVKKDAETETDRDIETRTNTVVMRKVNLCALTNDTKVVKISKSA
ncbi:MAG: hypothetical protein PHE63_00275 [Eubacteriales bacterium]|nr:hypothetical protein [Eubacteriales bacterium]